MARLERGGVIQTRALDNYIRAILAGAEYEDVFQEDAFQKNKNH